MAKVLERNGRHSKRRSGGRNPVVTHEWLKRNDSGRRASQPEWPPGDGQGTRNSRLFPAAAGQITVMGCFHTSREGSLSEGSGRLRHHSLATSILARSVARDVAHANVVLVAENFPAHLS